jgi:hypothetical protein
MLQLWSSRKFIATTVLHLSLINMDITIQVKLPNRSDKMDVEINTNDTVLQAKEKIAVVSGTPAAQQRLIFAGKVLKDNQIISDCSK